MGAGRGHHGGLANGPKRAAINRHEKEVRENEASAARREERTGAERRGAEQSKELSPTCEILI